MCRCKIAAVGQNDDVPGPDALAALAATASPTGTAIIDTARVVVWASPAFAALAGVATPTGHTLRELGALGHDLDAVVDDLAAGIPSTRATSSVTDDHGTRWFDIDCRPLDTADRILVTVHELTAALDHVGPSAPTHDPLTGLPGRDVAVRFVASAASDGSLVAISSVDLDQYEIVGRGRVRTRMSHRRAEQRQRGNRYCSQAFRHRELAFVSAGAEMGAEPKPNPPRGECQRTQ